MVSSGEKEAEKEIRKIMDDIWELYPKAQVEKGDFRRKESEIVFEVKN